MTPYEKHAALNHKISRNSPNGVDIIETCLTCGAKWLHNPCYGYPISMIPDYKMTDEYQEKMASKA